MKDKISIPRIQLLHPKVRDQFKKFIEDAEKGLGITLRVTQSLRTIAEQDALYAKGRTAPGPIVTKAKGGSSFHNYGLAIDVNRLDGKSIDWKYDNAKLLPYMPPEMEWGGHWISIKDDPHFQITFGLSWQTLLGKYKAGLFIPGTKYVNF